MSVDYVAKNDGFITASKLKCFLKNPEEFKLQYIDKLDVDTDKRCFIVGSAFDELVSYGEETFLNKYYIEDGLLKDDLLEMAIKKGEIAESVLKKWKLPELRAYLNAGDNDKVRLTPAEGRDIMGMYEEIKRQPLCDMGSDYLIQHQVECEYKGLKLRGTLDRLNLEKGIIRDRKTSGRIDNFEYDMEETFDYVISMAFYYILVKVKYKIECDVVLDVLSKKAPYIYIGYKLGKDRLLQKAVEKIIPGLEALIVAYQNNVREPINPLNGQPVLRSEMMKSPYYNYMTGSIQKRFDDPVN